MINQSMPKYKCNIAPSQGNQKIIMYPIQREPPRSKSKLHVHNQEHKHDNMILFALKLSLMSKCVGAWNIEVVIYVNMCVCMDGVDEVIGCRQDDSCQ